MYLWVTIKKTSFFLSLKLLSDVYSRIRTPIQSFKNDEVVNKTFVDFGRTC